jgi:hypothetical protein
MILCVHSDDNNSNNKLSALSASLLHPLYCYNCTCDTAIYMPADPKTCRSDRHTRFVQDWKTKIQNPKLCNQLFSVPWFLLFVVDFKMHCNLCIHEFSGRIFWSNRHTRFVQDLKTKIENPKLCKQLFTVPWFLLYVVDFRCIAI